MTGQELQIRLTTAIDLILTHFPTCLRVLVGESEPPTAEEMGIMCALRRIKGKVRVSAVVPNTEDETEGVTLALAVEQAGGWKHVTAIIRTWIEYCPKTWEVISDYVCWVGLGGKYRAGDSMAALVAEKFGIHKDTLSRYRREFPRELAEIILKSPTYFLSKRDTSKKLRK